MDKFITVRKDSVEFKKYIENRYDEQFRAVPVESQHINTEQETVTFEMKPRADFEAITTQQILVPLLKINKFLYFFFPIFFVIVTGSNQNLLMDSLTLILSWFSITSLFLAVNLRADYIDHTIGLDRILKKTATKPVSLGWISAYRVKRYSNLFFAFSILLGLPVIVAFPVAIFAVAAASVIIFWLVLRKKQSFRDHLLGDLGWSLLLGPVLSVGFELSLRGDSRMETLLFGFVWAVIVFYRIQLQNFEVIVEASMAKIRNSITWLGFDKGKDGLLILWGVCLILFTLFQVMYSHWLNWISILFICGFFTFKARKIFQNLKSPIGSEMNLFVKEFHQLYVLLTSLWALSLSFMMLAQFATKLLVF